MCQAVWLLVTSHLITSRGEVFTPTEATSGAKWHLESLTTKPFPTASSSISSWRLGGTEGRRVVRQPQPSEPGEPGEPGANAVSRGGLRATDSAEVAASRRLLLYYRQTWPARPGRRGDRSSTVTVPCAWGGGAGRYQGVGRRRRRGGPRCRTHSGRPAGGGRRRGRRGGRRSAVALMMVASARKSKTGGIGTRGVARPAPGGGV